MARPRDPRLLNPQPRPISHKGWIVLAIALACLTVVATFVITNYEREGGTRVQGGSGIMEEPGVSITVQATGLDPRTNTATAELVFAGNGPDDFDENGRARANTRVLVSTPDGVQEFKYVAGDDLGRAVVNFAVQGQEADYPFDHYEGTLFFSADTYSKQSDGSLQSTKDLPVSLNARGGIDGWNTEAQLTAGASIVGMADLTFSRAFSTRLFALMLLTLMTSLAFAAMWVALLVFTNRRAAEVALLGWTASLLFALPLLRNSMPNGPPIGASIDIFVFLWVLATAIVSAVLVVISYLRQKGAALDAERERERFDAT